MFATNALNPKFLLPDVRYFGNPDNPALGSSPKFISFALYHKVSVKLTDLRDMFRKASMSDSKSTAVESPDPLFLTPSTYAMKTRHRKHTRGT
jgi:hypothetical protein